MRVILVVTISAIMLSACMANWESNKTARLYAHPGDPTLLCRKSEARGMHLKGPPLCLTKSQWAEREAKQRLAGDFSSPMHHGPGMMPQPQVGDWRQ